MAMAPVANISKPIFNIMASRFLPLRFLIASISFMIVLLLIYAGIIASAAQRLLDHDRPGRPLRDCPHAFTHVETLGLPRRLAFDLDTQQRLRRKTREQGIAAPVGKQVAGVDDHAAG